MSHDRTRPAPPTARDDAPGPGAPAEPGSSRRSFLTAAAAAAGALLAPRAVFARGPGDPRPVVLVRFGGGVRAADALGLAGRRSLAPGLLAIARRGTLYTDVHTDAAPRHDLATAQLLTGRAVSGAAAPGDAPFVPSHALLTERLRDALGLPAEKVLAAGVPAWSQSPNHGISTRALSFEAPLDAVHARSLSGDRSLGPDTVRWSANDRIGRVAVLLGDRAGLGQVPWVRRIEAAVDAELATAPHPQPALHPELRGALVDRLTRGETYLAAEDADDWLLDLSLRALARHRPLLATIAFSSPDLAHQGPWRSYSQAVRRIDVLLSRLDAFLARDPFFAGRTTLLVTPDIGRGDPRYDGHDGPDDAARRLFLVASGPSAPAGRVVDSRVDQLDVAPTAARLLGVDLPDADGRPLEEIRP